ncbi:uncharacterized protein TNCV_4116461 [Trichonephila clavipes]|nr:uncharacterized protein TNCV_4116461 [Trichonephila clavipes]
MQLHQGRSYRGMNDARPPIYRGPDMCNYNIPKRALVSKKSIKVVLIQGPIRTSYASLIPPALPRNFELKGDHVDYMQKYATYHEMHFDFSKSRAKYMYLLNGIERHLLFDYEARQVIEYDVFHPGMDIRDDPLSRGCTATDLDDSEHKYLFGFLDEYSDWPKMYDQYQVMRFGGQYKYAYNGTNRMSERGLLVDKFVGCIYDQEMSATIAANYSFTSEFTI